MPLDRLDPAYTAPTPGTVPPPPPLPYLPPSGPYGTFPSTYTHYGKLATPPPYPLTRLDPEEYLIYEAHLKDHDASRTVNSDHSYTEEWLVHVSDDLISPNDVLDSFLLPQPGELYSRWAYHEGLSRYYRIKTVDGKSAVKDRKAKKDPESHYLWHVTIQYEGVADPFAMPTKVTESSIVYQETIPTDLYGIPLTNSANDPYADGAPIDRRRKRFVIERPLPIECWNSLVADSYVDTLNEYPHPVPGPDGRPQMDAFGVVYARPGTMKIADIEPEYKEQGPSPTSRTDIPFQTPRSWYVVVKTTIELDQHEFINNRGLPELRRWRHITIDKGYNEFVRETKLTTTGTPVTSGGLPVTVLRKKPIHRSPNTPTGEQLLDGFGKALWIPGESPELPDIEEGTSDFAPIPQHQYFTTIQGVTLSAPTASLFNGVDNPETLVAAIDPAYVGDPAKATVTVNTDGSFDFVPQPDFVGWYTFTFILSNADGDSAPATCAVLVGARPRVRVADRYARRDWGPIFLWLGVITDPLVAFSGIVDGGAPSSPPAPAFDGGIPGDPPGDEADGGSL